MSLLGIDVGTTGCKIIVFNIEGKILAQAYGEYPLLHSQPGWSELDSHVVWDKISDCIQSVAQQTKNDPVLSKSRVCLKPAPAGMASRLGSPAC